MAATVESNVTRLVCISDTHSQYGFNLPAGDILVHGGDFTMRGKQKEVETYLAFLKSLTQFRLKIIIAGNHDITLHPEFYEANWKRWNDGDKQDFEHIGRLVRDPALATEYGIIYLEDQEFVDPISGLKFYGR